MQGGIRMQNENNKLSHTNTPIVSSYLNDEGMESIIHIFLDEIPHRIADLQASFKSSNRDDFCKQVHQLKGAGGGYGFTEITLKAADIEKKLRVPNAGWKEEIQKNMDEFITVLQRVYAGKNVSGHV